MDQMLKELYFYLWWLFCSTKHNLLSNFARGPYKKPGDKKSTRLLVITSKIKKRMSNSSQSTRPVGCVLWEELLWEDKLHITQFCSLLHMLLKDKFVCLQDK